MLCNVIVAKDGSLNMQFLVVGECNRSRVPGLFIAGAKAHGKANIDQSGAMYFISS